MRLLLDLEKLSDPYSGLGQYCTHLTEAIAALLREEDTLVGLVREPSIGYFGDSILYRKVRWYDRWFLMRGRFDVWHNIHQGAHYWPRSRRTKTVLTIHDLNFLYRDDYSLIKRALRLKEHQRRLDKADAIVAISEYTAGQIREHLDVRETPISVIYNGCPPLLALDQGEAIAGISEPFVLGLGVMHPRKNWAVLLPLLQALPPGLQLVFAGHDDNDYGRTLRSEIERLGLAQRVRMVGPVTEAGKTWLMHHCEALWFPSLSEGFGMPVVEAMSVGKPVFLSTRTALPEVGGDLAHYWPSFEPGPMAEVYRVGMDAFRQNPSQVAEQLRARAETFTWKQTAEKYVTLYRALIAE